MQEMDRTGIPASITLAQGIIESRYGLSSLAKNSNNHFGIKCKGNWQGGTFYYKDDDYVNGKLVKSCFRTYKTPEESYYDHSEFLLVNKRYRSLFSLEKTDYKGWARGLKKAGYATAKDYATSLIRTIQHYNLDKYDTVDINLLAEQTTVAPPKAERINESNYLNFSVTTTAQRPAQHTETLVATAPPQPTLLPDNYKVGDGFKTNSIDNSPSNFHEDVYGGSSQYLDEISPQYVGRE